MEDFDVIFCRNVLVYFEPDVARRVSADLARRLTPEGLIAFGPMDLPAAPDGAEKVGPVQLNAWRRAAAPSPAQPRPPAKPVLAPMPGAPPRLEVSGVPLHLRALSLLEEQQWSEAQQMLEEANRLCPDYLPALLERALLHERKGERHTALRLMRQLREGAAQVEGLVSGPEPLPVEYYRSTAEVFLARLEGAP
jgi:hypothetical protein